MEELYLFDKDDKFLNILTKDEGLVDTWFKDYQNRIPDESFVFNVDSNSELLKHIKDDNQVAFYDRDGRLRLVRMKELYEVSTKDGHNIRVKCEPSFLELYDHFIEDKRITNGTAQTALNRALEGSRYIGEVTVDLGNATANFYWIDGIEAIFKILNTWGGALKDTITLNDKNEIIERKLWIVQRLGADNGLIVEPDYNAETISRNTLSYPKTALWGQGASIETDGGGHTRYITFEDVEWKKSKGDPVDKPKGQKWVGDPQALAQYGDLHNGVRKHRFGHFSNQDYETPEELLMATWQELQERKLKEIIHEAIIYESDKKISLGDTVTVLNREYNKPIELQSQITGLEYDVLFPDEEIKIVVGKYIDMNEDPLEKEIDDLKQEVSRPRPTKPIDNNSYPDIKPGIPINVSATGAFQTIQLFWDYDSNVYISHYEVYGSQISDFVPDEQHLLYRGKVSSFAHEVDTDQTWYYYVRSVNTRGTVGEFSSCVSASSIRVISDDILFGSIIADHLSNNLDIADKLAQNTIDRINEGPMTAIEYTQQEIEDTENRLLGQLNNRIGDINASIADLLDRTSGIEGTVINVKTDIDTINGSLSATITQLENIDGVVGQHTLDIKATVEGLSAKAEKSEVYTRTATDNLLGDKVNLSVYNNKMTSLDLSINGISGRVSNTETNINDLTGEVSSAKSQIANLDVRADGIVQSVSSVRADLDGLEIGGRNLFRHNSLRVVTSPVKESPKGTYANESWSDYAIRMLVDPSEKYIISAWVKRKSEIASGIVLHPIQYTTDTGTIRSESPSRTFSIGDNEWVYVIYPIITHKDSKSMALYLRTNTGECWVSGIKIEKGNKATDWSPAPEDVDGRVTTAEASITTLAGQVELKASQTSVNSLTGRMSNAESAINVNTNNIKLKVNEDGVIASINLSKEGLRIDGNKHHITGQTLIDDAVIGTAAIKNLAVTNGKIANLAVGTGQIQNLAVTNGKIANLAVDNAKIANVAVSKLLAGEIDTRKIKIRGGSSIDYSLIQGSTIELRGRYNRTWRGKTEVHDIYTRLENGYLTMNNPTKEWALYYMDSAISTYADGDGGGLASGTIEFRDYQFSDSRGLTVHSNYGVVALQSESNEIVIAPRSSSRVGINQFHFNVKDNPNPGETDGWIAYGSLESTGHSGIRFSKGGSTTIYATDGTGTIGTGDFSARRLFGELTAPATNLYVNTAYDGELRVTDKNGYNGGNVNYTGLATGFIRANSIRLNLNTNATNLYIGVSDGEARFTNNLLYNDGNPAYRPVRAQEYMLGDTGRIAIGSGITYIQNNGEIRASRYKSGTLVPMVAQTFNTSSLAELKQDIEPWTESALDEIRQATIYQYRLKSDVEDGINHVKYGFIIGDGYYTPQQVLSRDRKNIDMYSHNSLNTKAIQEVDLKFSNKIVTIKDKINKHELEIQYLKQKIKQLEKRVA